MDYKAYLKSDHWRDLRDAAISRWGCACNHCGKPKIDVHHLRYGSLFDVTTDDLIPLCRACHDKIHNSEAFLAINKQCPSSEGRRAAVLAYLLGFSEAFRTKRAAKREKPLKTKQTARWTKVERAVATPARPGEERITLTKRDLSALRSDRGGITGPVLTALGLPPTDQLPKGWFRQLRGQTIALSTYKNALSLKNTYTNGLTKT